MNAQEARAATIANYGNEYDRVKKHILDAVNAGCLRTAFDYVLAPDEVQKLESEGYSVYVMDSSIDEDCYIDVTLVSW